MEGSSHRWFSWWCSSHPWSSVEGSSHRWFSWWCSSHPWSSVEGSSHRWFSWWCSSHPWSSVEGSSHRWFSWWCSSHPWSSVEGSSHPWLSWWCSSHPWSSVEGSSHPWLSWWCSSHPWSSVVGSSHPWLSCECFLHPWLSWECSTPMVVMGMFYTHGCHGERSRPSFISLFEGLASRGSSARPWIRCDPLVIFCSSLGLWSSHIPFCAHLFSHTAVQWAGAAFPNGMAWHSRVRVQLRSYGKMIQSMVGRLVGLCAACLGLGFHKGSGWFNDCVELPCLWAWGWGGDTPSRNSHGIISLNCSSCSFNPDLVGRWIFSVKIGRENFFFKNP